ncbi:MurR/RpiR family transcriptional regulator [Jiangella alba]|uniref:DNA-binding transcriptional regulator, MurR/RpiR family, contains HTH and SIS domains n=1 Tax=Jiangella alba TaxID=561176 RepID=A0A1H5PY58_9ACTN|nr:MurR/RpiR family transcriptional regulator [Jiangella alba]SEF18118.1 DNA-binding transcriptional regulator, MurR/RpiR family, contains HTH and SIS domains [Jiangella alba]
MTHDRSTPRGDAGVVSERVRAQLPSLPTAEARVVNALLASGSEAIHLTVSDVAESAGVGVGTVVRACKSVGFKGFQDAKIALAQDRIQVGTPVQEGVDASDAPGAILRKLAASTDDALRTAPGTVDAEALERAVELLDGARRILFLAVGTSAPLAQDASYRLVTIGFDSAAPVDVHTQHVQSRLLRPDDVAVVVSHTGSTTETIAAARAAREAGASVIAITSFSTSPLTELATVSLVAGSRETEFRVEAMTSRFVHLLILDGLYVSLYLRNAERSKAAQALMADALAEHRF